MGNCVRKSGSGGKYVDNEVFKFFSIQKLKLCSVYTN